MSFRKLSPLRVIELGWWRAIAYSTASIHPPQFPSDKLPADWGPILLGVINLLPIQI
ncbi:hypothetical protein [Laspinema olomoucense]|uniref:hypothetical protein n=1 Tax=Laspinema olomoucense TaxID=3231600 RepID=UPI0021BB9AAA|nr:hypothetical protein [Laspinema sp. D3d]MCT7975206.1 hypothetical protein [Laspinema sp. D3d]